MRPWTAVLLSMLLAPAAQAADCADPYTIDDMLTDLAMTEAALRGGDNPGAGENAKKLSENLACADDILPGMMTARLYRAIGAGTFVGGDPDTGLLWMRTAAELEPEFEYAEADVAADHPARSALKLAKVEVMGTEPTPMMDAPDFGTGDHWLDGKPLDFPSATIDRNHVYQRVTEDTYSFVIEGNAFPDDAFGTIGEPEVVENTDPNPTQPKIPDSVVVSQSKWPAERVILLAAGGASLAASGALYGMSAGTRNQFDSANSVADMDKYQQSTNTLVVASGATGAAGVGMLGFGVLFFVVDGDPRPTLDIRF